MLAEFGWGEFTAVAGVIIGGIAVLGAFTRFYLRTVKEAIVASTAEFTRTMSGLQNWLERVDERVRVIEQDTPLLYVSKDDWLRALNVSQRTQMEAIARLAALDEKFDTETRLAAPLSAQAQATTELARSVVTMVESMQGGGAPK